MFHLRNLYCQLCVVFQWNKVNGLARDLILKSNQHPGIMIVSNLEVSILFPASYSFFLLYLGIKFEVWLSNHDCFSD